MVKTCKLVIAWKIHGSIPFRLVFFFFFVSVAYEIMNVLGFQHLVSKWVSQIPDLRS